MDLQRLIVNIIETMGGVVEITEYALARVLLPDSYKELFQGRTEITLAFDSDVAEEHPEADFVTYGSETMETLLDLALNTPHSDVQYIVVNSVGVTDAKGRVQRILGERCKITVLSERPVMGIWGVFVFRTWFTSFESFEEEHRIWVNMVTGELDPEIGDITVFFERDTPTEYPYAHTCSFFEAYTKAQTQILQVTADIAKAAVDPIKMRRETERIQHYYEELIVENERLLSRKGVTDERSDDIRLKNEALRIEMTRQINEIQHNIIPTPRSELMHGITAHVPLIEIKCQVSDRAGENQRTFYYDCLMKRLFENSR